MSSQPLTVERGVCGAPRGEKIVGCRTELLAWHASCRRVVLSRGRLTVAIYQDRLLRGTRWRTCTPCITVPINLRRADLWRLQSLLDVAEDILCDWSREPWMRVSKTGRTVVVGNFRYTDRRPE